MKNPSDTDILRAVYQRIDFAALASDCPRITRERVAEAFGRLAPGAVEPAVDDPPAKPAKRAEPAKSGGSLVIYSDGGSRGNPGPAAIGVVIGYENGHVVEQIGECIGRATNNVAEYKAMIRGAERAIEFRAQQVLFCVDSELLAMQVRGEYKTRSHRLMPLLLELRGLLERIPKWDIQHVYREDNRAADAMVNQALDERGR